MTKAHEVLRQLIAKPETYVKYPKLQEFISGDLEWRYHKFTKILEEINNDGAVRWTVDDIADEVRGLDWFAFTSDHSDISYAKLSRWLAQKVERFSYCEEGADESELDLTSCGLPAYIAAGQEQEIRKIVDTLTELLEDVWEAEKWAMRK